MPTLSSEKIQVKIEFPTYYFVSGFSHPTLPIITKNGIELADWGLIPFWIKDENAATDIRTKTLNAISDTVFEKPSFKKAIQSQRCLLPINGFYEWRDFNKTKYPYLIQLKDKSIFSLGCIYDIWVDQATGEIRKTFSILTTTANPLMEKIHNLKKRMPLIIHEDDERMWIDDSLKTEEIKKMIQPFDESAMTAYTISRDVNNSRFDRNVEHIIHPVQYIELPN